MTQEKQAEATVEVAQAKTLEELQSLTQTLQAERDKFSAERDEAKREARSHQEYGRKTKEELDKQRGLDSKVTRLEQRLEVATDMLADLLDREGEIEEPQVRRKSEPYRSRLAEKDKETKETQDQSFRRIALEADGLLKSVGLKMKDSPETMTAYVNFLEGNPEAGLEEVKKIVASQPTNKKEEKPEPVDIQKAIAAGIQAELQKRGLLDSDSGSPSGSVSSSIEAMDKYGRGEITEEEARKRGASFD